MFALAFTLERKNLSIADAIIPASIIARRLFRMKRAHRYRELGTEPLSHTFIGAAIWVYRIGILEAILVSEIVKLELYL